MALGLFRRVFSPLSKKPFSQPLRLVDRLLYIGQVRWKDTFYPGLHLPLIATTCFDEVQAIFANSQVKKKISKTTALFQKLLVCGQCQCVMTTSFAYNRTKTRYLYYRCTSTMKSEFKTSSCPLKYISQTTLEAQFFKSILDLCQPTRIKPIEVKISAHNQQLDEKAARLQIQATTCETNLEQLKIQRSKYLDALITNDFLSEERQLIRTQIQALETESNQIQSQLSHLRLEISHFDEHRIYFDHFKAQLIQLLELYQQHDIAQLQHHLPSILISITRYPEQWTVQFHSLPWPIDLPIFKDPENSQ